MRLSFPATQKYLNFFCDYLQQSQRNFMSMDLVLRGMMVSLVTPSDVELLHWMGVLCCGHPISMSACRSGTISLVMVERTSSSASEVDDMTFLIICAIVRTGTLWRGIRTSSERMMWTPARQRHDTCRTRRHCLPQRITSLQPRRSPRHALIRRPDTPPQRPSPHNHTNNQERHVICLRS